jgi:hypothetical protein
MQSTSTFIGTKRSENMFLSAQSIGERLGSPPRAIHAFRPTELVVALIYLFRF